LIEYIYIINFAFIILICLRVRHTGEAGEKPLRNRDKRVASYLFHNLALTRGRTEVEEVLHSGKVGCLHIFGENPLPYSGFIGDGEFFLESILFYC
jgi:hypothetical protein